MFMESWILQVSCKESERLHLNFARDSKYSWLHEHSKNWRHFLINPYLEHWNFPSKIQTTGISLKAANNKVRMVYCVYWGVTGYTLPKILYYLFLDFVSANSSYPDEIQMKFQTSGITDLYNRATTWQNLASGFPTKQDSNQSPQLSWHGHSWT